MQSKHVKSVNFMYTCLYTCYLTYYPPKVTEHPKSISADFYASITFQCRAKLNGNIQVQWKKLNSTKLPQTATIITNKSNCEIISILKIDKIIHHYKGYYYCVVKNEIGEVNSSMAQLYVDGMFIKHVPGIKYFLLFILSSSLPRNNRGSS